MNESSGHRRDNLLHRDRASRESRHALAEPHHLDPIRNLEHLWQVVTDEHHRQAPVADPEDQIENIARLHDPECGGRLIHEHDLARPRDRTTDRNSLTLTA